MPKQTENLNTLAWEIRRNLAKRQGVSVTEIPWKKCINNAIAVKKLEKENIRSKKLTKQFYILAAVTCGICGIGCIATIILISFCII